MRIVVERVERNVDSTIWLLWRAFCVRKAFEARAKRVGVRNSSLAAFRRGAQLCLYTVESMIANSVCFLVILMISWVFALTAFSLAQ